MNRKQPYFIDRTLLNHQLIQLAYFNYKNDIEELKAGNDITVKIDGINEVFTDCHIDNFPKRRLKLPSRVMMWIKTQFPFSVAYLYNIKKNTRTQSNKQLRTFYNALQKGEKLDEPNETLILSWITDEGEPYLRISIGFQITEQNAAKYLTSKAMAAVLPYILRSAGNMPSEEDTVKDGKCYIIGSHTHKQNHWLTAEEYRKTPFSHPGIYIMRRKDDQGIYYYYVGKANDFNKRIEAVGNKIRHINPQDGEECYDEVSCITINMDSIKHLYGVLNEKTPPNNPGVPQNSTTDSALYAIEDVAIHIAAMILNSEGKNANNKLRLDNRQYRSYTNPWR